jgi:hypothetical protein
MDHVSRPLLGLLAAAVAVFALYYVALKPTNNSGGSAASGPSAPALKSAVDKARGAVATSNAASVAHGGTVPGSTTPAPTATTPQSAASAASTTAASSTHLKLQTTPRQRLDAVQSALKAKKTLALLFYNPLAADDRAVKGELASVPAHGGKVFAQAIPVDELSRYPVVTQQVPITVTPTLVLIDSHQQASTIVGFADRFEISQRVSDTLPGK